MKVYRTGETVNVGYMQYEVVGSWYSNRLSSNEYLDEAPDASYLFVDLVVANRDKEQRTVPPFKLIDASNSEYGTSDKAWAAEGSIGLLQNLNPSVSKPRGSAKTGHVRSPQNRPYRRVARDVDDACRASSLQRHEQRIERR